MTKPLDTLVVALQGKQNPLTVTLIIPDLAHRVQTASTMSQTQTSPPRRRVTSLDLHQAKRRAEIPNIDANIEAQVLPLNDAQNINIGEVGREAKHPKNEKAVRRTAVDPEARVTPRAHGGQRNTLKAAADPLVNTKDIGRVLVAIVDLQATRSTRHLEVIVGPQVNEKIENLLEAAVGHQVNEDMGKTHAVAVGPQEAEERKIVVNLQGRAAAGAVEADLQTITGRVREEAIEPCREKVERRMKTEKEKRNDYVEYKGREQG